MRILLALLSLLFYGCLGGGGDVATLPANPTEPSIVPLVDGESRSVRIATWNVRNLFDSVDDSYSDDVLEEEEYLQKLRDLARVIESVDADFIALQEVENFQCLSDLNEQLKNPYPQLGLLEGNDHQRGIDVAFLSRVAIEEVVSHKDAKLPTHPDLSPNYKFSRDCLEVRLRSEPPLTFLVNHLKSGRGDAKKSAAKRRVQAEGIAQIATEVDVPAQVRGVVILGDLNDRPESWALAPLFERFVDPFASIPAPERLTHRYKKGGSVLDHILLDAEAAGVASAARVWRGIGEETSDHNPVSLELKIRVEAAPPSSRVWRSEPNLAQ